MVRLRRLGSLCEYCKSRVATLIRGPQKRPRPLESVNTFLDSKLFSAEEEALLHKVRDSILRYVSFGPRVAEDEQMMKPWPRMMTADALSRDEQPAPDMLMSTKAGMGPVIEADHARVSAKGTAAGFAGGEGVKNKENAQGAESVRNDQSG